MSRLRRAWQLLRRGWPRPVSPDPLTGIHWVNGRPPEQTASPSRIPDQNF